jgi:D-amino-acid oxidase
MKNIAVIGAGVIGLTSALRLLEKGFSVTIFARDIYDNITSRAAPALWVPFRAHPEELIIKWGRRSREVYLTLPESSGVVLMDVVEFRKAHEDIPLWAKMLEHHGEASPDQLPPGYTQSFTANIHKIDSSLFVDYLLNKVQERGGKIIQQYIPAIAQIDSAFSVIINCSGVWSHQLVPDPGSFPIKGQYLVTEKPPGLNKISLASGDSECCTLVAPRSRDCYISGTAIDHDWDTHPDENVTRLLFENALALEPLLANVNILRSGIGLRPGRKAVRLESEELEDGRMVIHNYGHGGAGFATAWGCAEEVVGLALKI